MLRNLQLNFLNTIFDGKSGADLPIEYNKNLKKSELIEIYRHSSKSALLNNINQIYIICEKIIGKKIFNQIAEMYIEKKKSISPNICDYGQDFPEFLKKSSSLYKWPYLDELAKLEWLCHEVSREPLRKSHLDFQLIQTALQQSQDIVFNIVPQIRFFCSSYPLYELWKTNQSDFIGKKNNFFLEKKQEHLIICRNFDGLCLYTLEHSCWLAVQLMSSGKSLKQIVDIFEKKNMELNLAAILPTILQENWVYYFELT